MNAYGSKTPTILAPIWLLCTKRHLVKSAIHPVTCCDAHDVLEENTLVAVGARPKAIVRIGCVVVRDGCLASCKSAVDMCHCCCETRSTLEYRCHRDDNCITSAYSKNDDISSKSVWFKQDIVKKQLRGCQVTTSKHDPAYERSSERLEKGSTYELDTVSYPA
jgi:hypothetical protein